MRRLLALLLGLSLGPLALSCKEQALPTSGPDAAAPGGLTPSQAAMVLARVGDRPITLGELAATLERMDQFDRLRYQTPERRRDLLDQIITVELLAAEAKRQGLQDTPEVRAAMRQILRDALLADARKNVRSPTQIPEAEVRAYYDAHKSEYQEPERRRVSHIVVKDKATAEKLIAQAQGTTAADWGALVLKHSADPTIKKYEGPTEMAGDLGLVGPPGDAASANSRVPEPVRAALFQITEVGGLYAQPVQGSDGYWHVVRLMAKTESHTRSFEEAERVIRIAMTRKAVLESEQALEAQLRAQYPVSIDDKALQQIKVPQPHQDPDPGAGEHDDHHH